MRIAACRRAARIAGGVLRCAGAKLKEQELGLQQQETGK